jgi:nitrogen fixation NifU-like protein
MSTYSEELINRFRNPKNVGEIENADAKVMVGNPVCGDVMSYTVKIKKIDGKDVIEDIKFKTFGCAAAIASSDVLCDLAKGKTVEEAKKLSEKDLAEALGGLPAAKMHCTHLAIEGLHKVLDEYEKKKAEA